MKKSPSQISERAINVIRLETENIICDNKEKAALNEKLQSLKKFLLFFRQKKCKFASDIRQNFC